MQHLHTNTTLQSGKYRIERVLGQGGFGITYLAIQTTTNSWVAIKEFFLSGDGQSINERVGNSVVVTSATNQLFFHQQKEKFKKEASRLSILKNTHIVEVHEMFEENGTAYYVMDYIEGENLRSLLKRTGRPLEENQVWGILQQALDALQTVHDANLWHLDLKPANIMLDMYGNIKLIDFGASKQLDTQKGGATTGTAISYTYGYAPREQMEQNYGKFGPWTDFYALGATLYTLLTNNHLPLPMDIDDDFSEDKHVALPMPNISPVMKAMVLWLMSTNRHQRPQNVFDIKHKISQYYNYTPTPLPPSNEVAKGDETLINKTGYSIPNPQTSGPSISSESKENNNSYIGGIVFAAVSISILLILLVYSFFQFIEKENTENKKPTNSIIENYDIFDETESVNNQKEKQQKTSSISENYAGKVYNYNIQVENGTLSWTFSGEGGNKNKKLNCNPDVNADIIIAEFKGLAYWDIASELIFNMVEEEGYYSYDIYESAKNALGKCASSLSNAKDSCPNAYTKAHKMYNDLINAENSGAEALWEELTVLSYALGENPIGVCDIYF